MGTLFKKIIKLIVDIAVILLIALVLLKVADHFFGLYSKVFWVRSEIEEKDYRQADSAYHHSLRPNSSGVHTSLGFRDREFEVEKPKGTFRTIMAGDSFVEGYGVDLEDTFTKVLEKNLKGSTMRCEVINAGIVSYSPLIEYLLIKNKLINLNPDLIILVFFAGADLSDDVGYADFAVFDSGGLPLRISPPLPNAGSFEEKRLFVKIFYYEIQIYNKIKNFILRGFKKSRRSSFFYGDIVPEENMVVGGDRNWLEAWGKTCRYLKATSDLLNERHVKFVIVMMPPGHHVSGKEWDIGRKFYGYRAGIIYKNSMYELMNNFCRKNSIYFCNLLDCFQASDIYPIYYRGDGHLTVAGNKLTADYLHDFLIKNNLIRR